MKLKTIACVFISVALCTGMLGMVGCASQSQDQNDTTQANTVSIEAVPIQINQSGFSATDEGEVNYVFTMSNPNDGYMADRITFSITGYDAEGNMVLGAAESVERIVPGLEYAIAGSAFKAGNGAVERIEITPSMDQVSWIPTDLGTDEAAGMFSVVDSRSGRLADETVSISGRVVADNESAIASTEGVDAGNISARVCAVLVDTSGNFVAGGMADGLVFDEREVPIPEGESSSASASGDDQVQEQSGADDALRAAQFSITIPSTPGFKECRYFVMPS